MSLLKSILEPNLRTVLIGISIYWFVFLLYMFVFLFESINPSISSLIFYLSYLFLLTAGINSKIKGFKVTNGITSLFFTIFSIASISFGVIGWDGSLINLLYKMGYMAVSLFLILFFSGYIAYTTLFNKNFSALYNNKDNVTLLDKTLFKISLLIFILVIGGFTIMDLMRL